jgi:nitroreductase
MLQTFIGQAPVVLPARATESEKVMMCGYPTYAIDVSTAIAYMLLQAYELGLGTCWIGVFNEDEIKTILAVPRDVRGVALSPLGYPASWPDPRPRKGVTEVVCHDGYR